MLLLFVSIILIGFDSIKLEEPVISLSWFMIIGITSLIDLLLAVDEQSTSLLYVLYFSDSIFVSLYTGTTGFFFEGDELTLSQQDIDD